MGGRRRRNRTVIVLVAALALLAAGCSWGQYGHDASRASSSPAEKVLDPGNVGALVARWQAPPGSAYGAQMANGSVFSVDLAPTPTPQRVLAFAADGSTGCSGTPRVCTPRWTAALSVRLTAYDALYSAYAVEGDRVYVVGHVPGFAGLWRLEVFDANGKTGCAGVPKTCSPLWSASWGNQSTTAGGAMVAVAGGRVYVSTPSGPDRVTVFDAAGVNGCTTGPTITCAPLFSTSPPSGGGPIAISGGHLVEGESFGLQVFDAAGVTGCANQVCTPERVIQNMGFPSIAGTTIYSSGGAFDLSSGGSCPDLGCQPTWKHTLAATVLAVPPAVAAGHTFVTETVMVTPSAGVEVFDAAGVQGCSGSPRTCTPVFTLVPNGSAQGVAATASLAFVSTASTGSGATLDAFDLGAGLGCAGAPRTCRPLWSARLPIDVGFPAPPGVTNGLVAVSGLNGGIIVFGLPQ